MKSAYQIDREMMAAWLKWIKAQQEADRAKAEYDRAAYEMKKCLEEAASTHTSDGQPHQNNHEPGRHENYSMSPQQRGERK